VAVHRNDVRSPGLGLTTGFNFGTTMLNDTYDAAAQAYEAAVEAAKEAADEAAKEQADAA